MGCGLCNAFGIECSCEPYDFSLIPEGASCHSKGRKPWNVGIPRTPEEKEALRKANLGRKQSPETIAKRSKTQTGMKRTLEQRKMFSEIQKANGGNGPEKHSEATKEKLRKAITGMKRSEETKARMRASALLHWEQRKRQQST